MLNAQTLIEAMEGTTERYRDKIAFYFHNNHLNDCDSISFTEIERRAKVLAGILQQTLKENDRVLLLLPPGIDYIIGFCACVYAKCIAIPSYLPLNQDLAEKLQLVLEDAQPKICLTNHLIYSELKKLKWFEWLQDVPLLSHYFTKSNNQKIKQINAVQKLNFNHLNWIIIDKITENDPSIWSRPDTQPHDIAFLQYTSGTTQNPKGVMVSHKNLLDNISHTIIDQQIHPDDIGVSWLPPYHDMGLIGSIISPLLNGYTIHLMSPLTFLKHPYYWLETVSRYRATITAAPNFAYELCCHKITEQQLSQWDFSSLRFMLNGAEKVHSDTLTKFHKKFSSCGLKPQALLPAYGLAEATLMVCCKPCPEVAKTLWVEPQDFAAGKITPVINRKDACPLVSAGKIIDKHQVCIVNPENHEVFPGFSIGEIWFKGDSVAQGYWQKPELSREVFQAYLNNGDGPYLRTGDLGFIYNDELYITGRIKDLIIINGKNYFPYDIEATIEQCSNKLKKGGSAVFSIEKDQHEKAVAIAEQKEKISPKEKEFLIADIKNQVYQKQGIALLDVILTSKKCVLKTTSGKKRRMEVKELYLKGAIR